MSGQAQYPTQAPVVWGLDVGTEDLPLLTLITPIPTQHPDCLWHSGKRWVLTFQSVGGVGRVSSYRSISRTHP